MRSPRLSKLTSYGLPVSYRLFTRAVRAVTVQPTKGGFVGWLNQLRANPASSAASATQRLSLLPSSRPEVGQSHLGGGGVPPFQPCMVVCAPGLSLKDVGMPIDTCQALQAVRISNNVLR